MKKIVSAVLMAAVLSSTMVFSGCSSTVTPASSTGSAAASSAASSATASTFDLKGSLHTTGSTSMQKVCDALGEAFKEKYPNVTFLKDGTGSGEAAAAVTNGTAQIGDLSRKLKDSETPDAFTTVQIAIDGIAIVVNPANKVTNLTKDQITKIFTGAITDWKDVGGEAGKITVIGREAASGTRDGFESYAGIKDKAKYAAEVTSTGEVITKVASDKLAIGYASLDAVDKTVVATKVENVAPSEATIVDGTYPVQRPFIQIYKKGSTDPIVKAWFEFVASDEGQQVIKKAGLVLPKK